MPILKDVAIPNLGVSAAFWRVQEVRDVRQAESGFTGALGNLFVQVNGYASEDAFTGGGRSLASTSFRIRYGADIPDPLPERFAGVSAIRNDAPSAADIEAELLNTAHFAGGTLAP